MKVILPKAKIYIGDKELGTVTNLELPAIPDALIGKIGEFRINTGQCRHRLYRKHRKYSRRLQRVRAKILYRPIANALGIPVNQLMRDYENAGFSASRVLLETEMAVRKRIMKKQQRFLGAMFDQFVNTQLGESLDQKKS